MMNKVAIIIPARYYSERLPGKLLLKIKGKPLLYYTYKNALKSKYATEVIIATDSDRIVKVMSSYGAKVLLTSRGHRSGSDRIEEASTETDADIIVNLQGDEPLLKDFMIDKAIEPVIEGLSGISTLKTESTIEEYTDNNTVKVVSDNSGFALYFSRSPIPYIRNNNQNLKIYKHIGLYVYRKSVLHEFVKLPTSLLEAAEGLEQLRFMENGYKIMTVPVNFSGIGVDTRQDFEKVKGLLKNAD